MSISVRYVLVSDRQICSFALNLDMNQVVTSVGPSVSHPLGDQFFLDLFRVSRILVFNMRAKSKVSYA